MKNSIYILLVLINLWACEAKKPYKALTPQEQAQQKKEDLANLAIELSNPIQIGQSDLVIFPLSANLMLSQDEDFGSSLYRKEKGYAPLWNMIFFNKKTFEKKLLFPTEEVIIQGYFASAIKKYEGTKFDTTNLFIRNHIFYEIIAQDYNQDKKVNLLDPTYLYISDLTGNKLQRISPLNQSLLEWWTPWNDNHFIIRTTIDNNGDGLFNEKDNHNNYFLVDLNKPQEIREIIDYQYIQKLKNLYLNRQPLIQ